MVPETAPEPEPVVVLALGSRLLQAASDPVRASRGTEDVLDDVGRGIGSAARDITGNGSYSGTPSWEPDSSAVRY